MSRGQAPDASTLRAPGAGLGLAADHWPSDKGQPILLSHGGGQTRHAWGATARVLAARGYSVTNIDLRGHGDSDWASDGDYGLDAYRDDLRAVLAHLDRPAVLIGASLGGMASMLVAGEGPQEAVKALVLVDITHAPASGGVEKIQAFMTANRDGFASVEEAADAVAAYLPHRPRPRDPSGLMKNLRERGGRLHWHWDPAFTRNMGNRRLADDNRLERAARAFIAPTLLVRGDQSDIVSAEDAASFVGLIPHARVAEVAGAAHMVAGDQNTVFGDALLGFLEEAAPA